MTDPDLLTDAGLLLSQQHVAEEVIERVISELRRRYGGDRHFILKIDRERRNQGIAADLAAGLTDGAVAQRQKCARSTVQRVRNEWRL
ncbi:MAG: hypothetical protein ACOYMW_13125 [Candidatus Competibacteraceae bacterium]